MAKTPRNYLVPKTKAKQGKKRDANRLKKKYRPHACEGCESNAFTYHASAIDDDPQQQARCTMCGREQTIDIPETEA